LSIDDVREVIRMPRVTRVPHAPPAMLGLANVRGAVIPVFSAAALLDCGDSTPTRLVVIADDDQAEWLGLAVDETVQGAGTGHDRAMRARDVATLARRSLPAAAPPRAPGTGLAPLRAASDAPAATGLVAFAIGDQEFALPVDAVVGVAPLPAAIALLPDSDAVVIGSAAVAGDVLPLLCLRALLALPVAAMPARRRVVIVTIGDDRVGLVVDAVRGIVAVADDLIDPLPRALRRGAAEARIQAICRLDDGRRLISVLAADRLLRDDVTVTMLAQARPESEEMTAEQDDATEQFVIFRIGSDEFAIGVAEIEEVVALPPRLTRLPGAPAFVQGVMNLRGSVVPVIDQGQRFGTQPVAGVRARVIVMRIGDLCAGFVVDAVTGVVRVDAAAVRPAPDLGTCETHIFERVVNLVDEQRIVLVISPRELLDRAEADVLLALGKQGTQAGP
jgi:purine-binding chemotaxis protein CheW